MENEIDYHSREELSFSQLKDILKSPKTFHYNHILKKAKREDSDALILGRAIHAAVLEPSEFKKRFKVKPQLDKRTKIGKEEFANWESSINHNDFVVEEKDADKITGIIESISNHKKVSKLLSDGVAEKPVFWTDNDTGLKCRAKPDFLVNRNDSIYIVDLKTTRDADPESFSRAALKYKYFMQAAFYLDGVIDAFKMPTFFCFVAIEKTAPYEIGLYVADETIIDCGRAAYKKALKKYLTCKETNEWHGLCEDFVSLSMPHWALNEWSDENE